MNFPVNLLLLKTKTTMATISFTTIFNLAETTKQFHFTDTSDYVSQGFGVNDMFGAFRIVAPSGSVVYDKGTPSTSNYDIRNATSRDSVGTIAIPLDSGVPEQGLYSILYTVWDDVNEVYYTVTETFNFLYVSPVIDINGTVAVYTPSPLITLQDTTVYQVNNVNPTISRVATISYEPILINNVLTTPDPTIGSTATTTSNYFFSPTTETLSIISNLTYVYTGTGANTGFTVIDLISGLESLFVDATSYCSTVCGLNQMAVNLEANPQDATLANDFNLAMSYWTLIQANQNCGDMTNISHWISQIQSLGSFDSSCTCCDGQFTQVVGLGGLVSAYDMISANSYIAITSNTSGGTKTYTFTFSQTFVDLVEAQGASITTLQGQMVVVQDELDAIKDKEVTVTSSNSSISVGLTAVCVGAIVSNDGINYVATNTLTAVGGTGTATQIVVDTVDGSGNILTYHVSVAGSYTVLPSNPVTFTGGAGTGASFNLYYTKTFDLSGNRWQTISYAGADQDFTALVPYLECPATIAYPATQNAVFMFAGTNNTKTITKIIANLWRVDSGSVSIKIMDLTNSTTICEVTGITSTSEINQVDMGTLSNLPTAAAVFGIFVSTGSEAKKDFAKLASLIIG